MQFLADKYRSLERINGRQYRELGNTAFEQIKELKKEIKEKNYDENMDFNIDQELSEYIIKDEKDDYQKNIDFIEKCKEQELEIRRKYQTILGKSKMKELDKKIAENNLNKSFEITQIIEEKKMRKSETKFIIRFEKSFISFKFGYNKILSSDLGNQNQNMMEANLMNTLVLLPV